MSKTRLPRQLDDELREVRRLHPTEMSVTLQMTGVSEASITLADDDEAPPMHAFVEIYTERGSAGIFRVTNIARSYRQEITLTLRHGIDTLSDSLWRAQETWTGTMTAYLTRLLSFQTVWQLGTCECASTITEREMNYDRLSALLEAVEAEETDYRLVYDQTTTPWTLSMVARTSAVSAEFRLRRNAHGCTVTLDDSEMCNKLRLSANHILKNSQGKKTGVDTAYFDYENVASQALWGTVEKVADIEVHEDVKAGAHAEADAWAARFLLERAAPSVQIQVDGLVLKGMTGDAWDEPKVGQLCRVALPEYGGAVFRERVVSLTWPDPLGDPLSVQVSLANELPRFSETLAQVRETARRAGRVSRRASQQAEISGYWDMIVREIDTVIDGTGIRTLWETGIVLDAQSGATIYSVMAGLEALNSVLKISHNGVESLVAVGGCELDEDGHLVVDEHGNPVFVAGNNLYSRIVQTATEIESTVIQAGTVAGVQPFDSTATYAVGDYVTYNNNTWRFTAAHTGIWDPDDVQRVAPLSSRVSQTESSWSATVQAVGSGGQITAATIAAAINDSGSNAYIEADHIYLTGSVSLHGALDISNGELTSTYPISTTNYLKGGSLTLSDGSAVGSIAAGDIGKFVKSMTLTYDSGTSQYTLAWTDGQGSHSENFSRAAATTKVSGAWSSGVYVISANPNGQNLPLSLTVTNTVGAVTNVVYVTSTGQWLGDVSVTPSVGGSSGNASTYQIDVQAPINAGVGAGWANAAGEVIWPSQSNNASFGVTVPAATWGTTDGKTFTLRKSGAYAYCNDGTNDVARVSVTGSITADPPQSTQPSTSGAQALRTVTVGTGGNTAYVKISATGYRNSDDYITIKY